MSTKQGITRCNTAMQKYPYQGRKIKHNRRERVQEQEKVPKIPAPPVFGVSLETQDKQPKLLSEEIVHADPNRLHDDCFGLCEHL